MLKEKNMQSIRVASGSAWEGESRTISASSVEYLLE